MPKIKFIHGFYKYSLIYFIMDIIKTECAAARGRRKMAEKVCTIYTEARQKYGNDMSDYHIFNAIAEETGYCHNTIRKILVKGGIKVG